MFNNWFKPKQVKDKLEPVRGNWWYRCVDENGKILFEHDIISSLLPPSVPCIGARIKSDDWSGTVTAVDLDWSYGEFSKTRVLILVKIKLDEI